MSQFLEDLSEKFLTCRTYGHSWKPYQVDVTSSTHGSVIEYRSWLRCLRCKTQRYQIINPRGEILRGGYRYPDGYQASGESIVKADARVEFIGRMTQ